MPDQNKSLEDKDGIIAQLRRDLLESKAETAACLRFLSCELGWECFRLDLFYSDEKEAKFRSASERNAQRLKEYLRQSGHGIALLAKFKEFEGMLWWP